MWQENDPIVKLGIYDLKIVKREWLAGVTTMSQ